MNELQKMKLNNDYKRTDDKIAVETDFRKLMNISINILRRIKKNDAYAPFIRLADNAEHKSKVIRILAKCPKPSNDTLLEQIAFNNFVEGTAKLNKMPSVRVIHHQLKKLGYAKTMAKQVEKSIGNAVFFDMAKKGIVKHTSEFFIYKYGQHLVKATTYKKIADLFNSNEQLLEVA
jgi:hypothetical protein